MFKHIFIHEKAIESFYKALEINNNDSTYTHLGKLLVACGEYEEAIALYEQAITYLFIFK